MTSQKPTPDEADRLLAAADALRGQVSHRAARESRAFLGWGLFLLVMLPPFDVLNGNVWGPIFSVAAAAAWITTTRYFRNREDSVKVGATGGWSLAWVIWAPWYGSLVVLAVLTHNQISFIWTLVAIGGTLPLFAVGVHLTRQGR